MQIVKAHDLSSIKGHMWDIRHKTHKINNNNNRRPLIEDQECYVQINVEKSVMGTTTP